METKEEKHYKILERNNIKPNMWAIKYEVWEGCYCTKKTKEAIVIKSTMPLLRDLLRVLKN